MGAVLKDPVAKDAKPQYPKFHIYSHVHRTVLPVEFRDREACKKARTERCMRAKQRSPLVLALVFPVVLLGRVDGMDAISTYLYAYAHLYMSTYP